MNRTPLLLALLAVTIPASAQQGITRPAITPQPRTTQPDPLNPSPKDPKAPKPPPAPAGVHVAENYILGTDDVIQVDVWKEPTLTGPLLIRPDGKISMPLLGDLQAATLSPAALGKEIETKLKKFITDPSVTVTITGTASQKIYFIGEVQRPGPMALAPGMTVLQAISSVGGLTPYANAKHIYILRGATGQQKKIEFDYKKAVKQGLQQGIVLAAGDTIVVP